MDHKLEKIKHEQLDTTDKIDNAIKDLTDNIQNSFNEDTKIKTNPTAFKIQINLKTKNLIRLKNRLRSQHQKNPDPILKLKITNLTNEIKACIKSIRTLEWEKTLRKINPQNKNKLWTLAKNLRNPPTDSQIPPLQH